MIFYRLVDSLSILSKKFKNFQNETIVKTTLTGKRYTLSSVKGHIVFHDDIITKYLVSSGEVLHGTMNYDTLTNYIKTIELLLKSKDTLHRDVLFYFGYHTITIKRLNEDSQIETIATLDLLQNPTWKTKLIMKLPWRFGKLF